MGSPVNASYILKQIERRSAACLTAFMHDMGGYTPWLPGAWNDNVAGHLVEDSMWRLQSDWPPAFAMFTRNEKDGKTNWSHHDGRHNEFIAFPNPRFGDGGDVWEGDEEIVHQLEVNDDSKSKVFTNFTDSDESVAYEEEVALEHSDESHFDNEWAVDVGLSSSQEVGGSGMGVEAKATFEQSLNVHAGGSSGGSSSDTTSNSDTVSINETIPAGAIFQLTIFKHRVMTRQPYKINAAYDFDTHFKWCHWDRGRNSKYRGGNEEITVEGVAGIAELIAGHNTNFPSFEGYHPVSRVRNGIAWIEHAQNRWLSLSGVRLKSTENNVDYKLVQLHQDAIPSGIEVVDMSDPNNKRRYGNGG